MYTLKTHVEKKYAIAARASLLSLLIVLFIAPTSEAQPVAGPAANPLPRMNCTKAGAIRADDGKCVAVESYFSTGTNAVYWVSQATGSDSNPGTKANPWKTISRSTRAGVLRPGDAVIIRGGTYRETIANHEAGRSGKRITFAAYPGEEVVVSGADPMNSGWTASGNAWRHDWTLALPAVPNTGTIATRPEFRREMVIVDGKVLMPVYARSQVVPGTFYVEGSDVAPKAIYMRLPSDDSPSGHSIEVGRRSALFLPKDAREEFCGAHYGYYRVVGLTFRHAVNNGNWGAVCSGREGSLLEENTVEWTNGLGFDLQGYDNVVRGNRANDNGMQGVGGRCTRCRIEYNETSRNNWKNYPYGYAASGIKLIYTSETVLSHHVSSDNNATGIWFDVTNNDNVIENSIVSFNTARGILLEKETVTTTVRNNVVYGTRYAANQGAGIQSQASSRNIIIHNTIVENEGHGIYIRSDDRFEDGYNEIHNNLLINNGTKGGIALAEIRIDAVSLAEVRTNSLDGNRYWSHSAGSESNTFFINANDGTSYRGADISKWQDLTRSDANAGMLDVSVKQIADRRTPDGWQLVSTSQAIGRGAALPVVLETDIQGAPRPSIAADVGADQYAAESLELPTSVVGETGSLTISQSGPSRWHSVALTNAFSNPVVIMSPLSFNKKQPATVRVRNVTSGGFEFQIDEWEYLDGRHGVESVHYAVFEAGRHVLGDGIELEAGLATRSSDPASIAFSQSFSRAPVVLSQIVSTNDPSAAVTRQQNVTSSGFDIFLQGEQADASHGSETVAFVAISMGTGSIGTYPFTAGATSRSVNDTFSAIGFAQSFSTSPVFLASMQTANGLHTATLRYRNLTGTGVEVKVEEEQSKDAETSHTTEQVGYVAFAKGSILTAGSGGLSDLSGDIEGFVESGGQVVFDAESYDATIDRDGKSWSLQSLTGNVGSSMSPGPLSTTLMDTGYTETSPEMQYSVHFANAGTYYVWMRAYATGGDRDSWHVGLNGQEVASADRMAMGNNFEKWIWTNRTMDRQRATLSIPASGTYAVNVWMREDGVVLDRVLLTTDPNFKPTGEGPVESARSSAAVSKASSVAVEDRSEGSDPSATPGGFELIGNYPNPFNPETTIRYNLPEEVHVTLEVYNLLGRRVAVLVDGTQYAGNHGARFNAGDLPSGLYVYRLQAGTFVKTAQMVLVK